MAKSRTDPAIHTRRTAEFICGRLDIPLTAIRWATYYYHTGNTWTLVARWERLVDDRWIEVELDEWQDLH